MASSQFYKILRYIIIGILLIVVAVIGSNIIMKFKQVPEAFNPDEVEKVVSVEKVTLENLKSEIQLLGIIHSANKIELFAEQSGILKNNHFKEGKFFKQGEIILDIDGDEFNQNVKAQKGELIMRVSQLIPDIKIDFPEEFTTWENFLNQIDLHKKLPTIPSLNNPKLKRFVAGKGLLNLYYSIEGLEKKLAKFTIEAPFDGVITEVNVQKGTLVRVGQKLGEFIAVNSYELESEVSVNDLQYLKIGTALNFKQNNVLQAWKGEIIRINSKIDPKTQRIKVYAQVNGEGIKDGMYVSAFTEGIVWEDVFAVNRQLVQNGKIYIVKKNQLKLKNIQVLFENESQTIVKGLNNGDLFLQNNLKGLYEGMVVKALENK
jgi:multidrug efflux pump subunit AcrA (membrane-fusion protein)